jgi:hypothetical protein
MCQILSFHKIRKSGNISEFTEYFNWFLEYLLSTFILLISIPSYPQYLLFVYRDIVTNKISQILSFQRVRRRGTISWFIGYFNFFLQLFLSLFILIISIRLSRQYILFIYRDILTNKMCQILTFWRNHRGSLTTSVNFADRCLSIYFSFNYDQIPSVGESIFTFCGKIRSSSSRQISKNQFDVPGSKMLCQSTFQW